MQCRLRSRYKDLQLNAAEWYCSTLQHCSVTFLLSFSCRISSKDTVSPTERIGVPASRLPRRHLKGSAAQPESDGCNASKEVLCHASKKVLQEKQHRNTYRPPNR